MSLVLIDTNIASALYRQDSALLERYADAVTPGPLAIALQTSAELRYGAERALWGITRRNRLETLISRLLVMTPDQTTAHRWAQVMAHSERLGRLLSPGDAWIAATAIQNGLTLITHDRDLDALNFPGLILTTRPPVRPASAPATARP